MKKTFLLILSWMLFTVAHATITPTSTQMWWGYFNESQAASLPYDGNLGLARAATLGVAIAVPANDEIVGSSTIKAIRFWIGNDYTYINSDVKVWISTSLPTSPDYATYVQTVSKSALQKGEIDVELTTPFEVNNQAIYVGYTFSISQKAYPIMSAGQDVPNAFFINVDNGEWDYLYGQGYGNLALQVLLDGGSYSTSCVTVADFGKKATLKGTSTEVPVTFTNKGTQDVNSISYTLSEGGSTSEEQTIVFSTPLAMNTTTTSSVKIPAAEICKNYTYTLTVTKVNGNENTAKAKSATGTIIVISEALTVTPAVEEFTGTWCGYCPYGIVGMQKAHETFGDKVVLIAAHSGDVMAIDDYSPIVNGVGSFPDAFLNRKNEFYPTSYSLVSQINNALTETVLGSVQLTATWTDANKTAIIFATENKFVYNDDNGQYGIAFVLTEDGLTGSNYSWAQSNYLSGESGSSEMSFWYNSGSQVYNFVYDHVAVAAWDIKNGVQNSVNPTFTAGETLTFNYEGSISNNTLIQDKSKLKAIALLIDRNTGAIVNAAQCDIKDFTTGIQGMTENDQTPVARYSLDGRQLSAPQKGLNIVKTADGRTVKVLVK